jgi:hypothetical protein
VVPQISCDVFGRPSGEALGFTDDPEVSEIVGLSSSLLRGLVKSGFCNKDVLEGKTGTEREGLVVGK